MKKFLKATAVGAAYFGAFMAAQFLVSLSASLILLGELVSQQGMEIFQNLNTFHEAYMGSLMEHITGIVLISNILTILGFWLFFLFRHQKFFREIGLRRTTGRNLAMSVIFGTGVCFFVDLLTTVLPFPEPMMNQFEMQHGMLWFGDAGLTFLSIAIIGPVSEEICFRGLCYTRLRQGMAPWAAGIFSSIFFGLAHGDPVWFLVGFLAGISLSWTFETTGSLYCAILVHITNNAISSLANYLPMPDLLHRILIFSSPLVALAAGACLHRWNHRPVDKKQLKNERLPESGRL